MTGWPPPSVWLLSLALVAPPATAAGYDWLNRGPAWHVPGAMAAAGLVAAGGLVGVPPAARWWGRPMLAAVGLVGPTLLAGIYAIVSAAVAGQLPFQGRPTGHHAAVCGGLLGMTVLQLLALWWPGTGRWCGLLPPREADA